MTTRLTEGAPAAPTAGGRGLLISLEGVDGCGKSTQAAVLAQRLGAAGRRVASVREPGATDLGRDVREIVLHRPWEQSLDPWAEALLLVAARAQLIAEVIRPEMAAGAVVLCDRFVDSTLAYQGVARGLGVEPLRRLHVLACGDIWPDLTLFLDIDAAAAARRRFDAALPLDRMESGGDAFLTAVVEGFRGLARSDAGRIVVVDASRGPGEVADAIAAVVEQHLGIALGAPA